MNNETLLIIIGGMQLLLTISTANKTASASALTALSGVIATLRSEVKEVTKARESDKETFNREIAKREAYIQRLVGYIQILVELLNKHQISVPEMPDDDFDKIS